MLQSQLKQLRRTANLGLYGSVAVALAVIAFYYLSDYRFYLDANASRWLFFGGIVLAVVVCASALLTVNRKPRQLRQLDSVEQRVAGYASMVRSLYSLTFATNLLLCAIILLTHNNTLLMFILVMTLLLFLAYPNMYRVKADLGLTHEQMHDLYGDDYKE